MELRSILETSLYVDDLDAARQFYTRLLAMEPYAEKPGRHLFFKLESGMLLLFNPEESARDDSDLPPHGGHGPGHLAFQMAPSDLPEWRARIQAMDIPIESDWPWSDDYASLYFRDPAGNLLEITSGGIWGYSDG